MDKGILRFMAEAYLLLHAVPMLESVAPAEKGPKKKQRRHRGAPSMDNKEAKSGKPPEEG
jgi:hypothetical protein